MCKIAPYIVFLSLVLAVACSTAKTLKPEDIAKEKEITSKVEQKNFTIEVNQANPLRGRSISLSFGYTLELRNDSSIAHLPYYGVAHSSPYGGEGGIRFATLYENWQIIGIKDGWDITFRAKAKDSTYDVYLTVFRNGSSTLSIHSNRRDPISFYGRIKE